MINRVGYYNFSSNVGSIPKYKINSFISLTKAKTKYSFITRYVSSYKNQTPVSSSHQAMGYTNKVDNSIMTDFSIEMSFKMNASDVIFKINIENGISVTINFILKVLKIKNCLRKQNV